MHLPFLVWLICNHFEVAANGAFIFANFHRSHAITRKKWLLGFVELTLSGVRSRSHRNRRFLHRLNQVAFTHGSLTVPSNCILGRLPGLIFNELVTPRAYPAWVVDEATHFADFLIVILICVLVNDWSQETRWNAWHWHLLKTGVAHDSCSSTWRDCWNDSDWINYRSWNFSRTWLASHGLKFMHLVTHIFVAAWARSFNGLSLHLNLRHVFLNSWILLGTHVDMTIVLGKELVFGPHASQTRCLLENTHFALVLTGT